MSRDTRRHTEPSPLLLTARVVEHPSDECGTAGADMRWRG
jgi:hypothetical protein